MDIILSEVNNKNNLIPKTRIFKNSQLRFGLSNL